MQILSREEIKKWINIPNLLHAIEEGFVLPPVGLLHFENPPGDCHIKNWEEKTMMQSRFAI